MPIPGAAMPTGDMDSYEQAAQQLPVPQGLHSQIVFQDAATDFTRKAVRSVPDILYRALGDFGQGDADTDQDAAQRDKANHVWLQDSTVPAETLNERYGVPGVLRFNTPTTEEDAAWQSAQAHRKAFEEQVFAHTKPQPLTDFGLGLAGSLVDPVGLPLMLATGGLGDAVLGGGKAAEGAVETARAVSRLGKVANALRVPAQGALSNLPFVAANAGLSQYVGDDYSLTDGLRDLAAGAILHTGLHFAGEGLRALGRRPGTAEAPIDGSLADMPERVEQPWTNPVPASGVPAAVDDLGPTARAAAFAKAVDDMAGDNPVDVGRFVQRETEPQGLGYLDEPSAEPQIQSFRPVNAGTAVTPRGTEVPVQYGLAELDDLTTSHGDNLQPNPDYPQALQPRDRSRAGAQANNYRLEAELNPKLLMTDTAAGSGAPIVAPDGTVESGNGRTIALRRSAASGGEAYARYVAELKAQGFNVDGMRRPVLVRMRTEAMQGPERAALAREMNADVVERMGAVEQAMADATRIPDQALGEIPPNLGPTTSRDFAREFIARAAPDQVNTLTAADGALSPEGARRIKAAVLARAYGDPRLVGQIFEGEETPVRQHAEGLAEAAPAWAKMRGLAARGEIPRELDITDALTSAMDLIRYARQEGESVAQLLAERLGQTELFGGEAISPQTEAFLRLMYRDRAMTKPESPEKIASALRDYARQASNVTPGENLFGETAGEDTARQILANLAERYARGDAGPVDSVRAPGQPAEPRASVVDVPDAGGPGDGAGEGIPPGAGAGAEDAGAAAERDAAGEARGPSAQQIIASDPELKELMADTARLAAAHGLAEPELPEAEKPETFAKAAEALAQCLIEAPEEVL